MASKTRRARKAAKAQKMAMKKAEGKTIEKVLPTVDKDSQATTSFSEVNEVTNSQAEVKEEEVKVEMKDVKVEKIATTKDNTKALETKAGILKETPVKETAAKKAPAKKAPAKRTTKKAEVKTEMFLQFGEKEYSEKEIFQKVKDVWTKVLKNKVGDLKDVKIYVKPADSAAYYVINGEVTGKVEL